MLGSSRHGGCSAVQSKCLLSWSLFSNWSNREDKYTSNFMIDSYRSVMKKNRPQRGAGE